MRKHTSGPWEVFPSSTGFIISKPNEIAIAGIPNLFEDHPAEANARLIASAPDLLDQLMMCVEVIEDSGKYPLTLHDAKEAIAKALG